MRPRGAPGGPGSSRWRAAWRVAGSAALPLLVACQGIDSRCSTDADCEAGARCLALSGARFCVAPGAGGSGSGGSGGSGGELAYQLAIDLADPVGRSVDATVHESTSPPGGDDRPITVRATLSGNPVTAQVESAGSGAFLAHLELPAGAGDAEPLAVHAELADDASVSADAAASADVAGPRLDAPEPPPAPPSGRLEVAISLTDAHGGALQAFGAAAGQTPPESSTWPVLALDAGHHATFSVSAADLGPLPALDGAGRLYLLARDDLGNETRQEVSLPLTRRLLAEPLELPGAASGEPALLPDGRILLVLDGGPGLMTIDPDTLIPAAVSSLPPDGVAQTPAVGEDALYLAKGFGLFVLDATTLTPLGSCPLPSTAGTGPAVGRAGTTEVALAGLIDGSYASFRKAAGPGGCTGTVVETGATSAGWPAAVDGAAVVHALVPGSGAGGTMVALDVDAGGAMTVRGAGGLPGADEVTLPVAVDGTAALAVSGDRIVRVDFAADFSGMAQAQDASLGSVATGPPVIGASDILVPTKDGLAVVARSGKLADAIVLSLESSVASPVIGADGTVWVASQSGTLYALAVSSHQASVAWSDAIGAGVRVTPLLTCDGRLWIPTSGSPGHLVVVQTDSKGLDAGAPWPRLQHDGRNTGNPATSNACR